MNFAIHNNAAYVESFLGGDSVRRFRKSYGVVSVRIYCDNR